MGLICDICGHEIDKPESELAIWDIIIHGYCYHHILEDGYQMILFSLENYEG